MKPDHYGDDWENRREHNIFYMETTALVPYSLQSQFNVLVITFKVVV